MRCAPPLLGFLCAVVLAGAPPAAAERALVYTLTQWTTDDGLPSHSVTGIAQTPDGYLWLATTGGLVRFDGHRFVVFDDAPGLTAIRIVTVFVDRAGTLWVGADDGRVFRRTGERFAVVAADFIVSAMGEDRDGHLWAADATRLARLDDKGWRHATAPSIEQAAAGVSFVGVQRSGSHRGVALRVPHFVAEPTGWRSLRRDGRTIEIPDDDGRARWRRADGPGVEPWLIGRTRVLWTWTDDALEAHRPGEPQVAARVLLPPGCSPVTLFEDREGNLWVGTRRDGLLRVSRTAFTVHGAELGQAWSVSEGADGRIVVSDADLVPHVLRDGAPASAPEGGPGFVFTDGLGTEWAVTGPVVSGTLNGVERRYTSPIGDPLQRLVANDPSRKGVVWLGRHNAAVRFAPHESPLDPFGTVRDGFPHALSLLVERSGALLVGNAGGVLQRFSGPTPDTFTPADGLPPVFLRALHQDANGTIWIGTYGGGLIRHREGRFAAVTARDGLAESIVSTVLEDEAENLWLAGNRTIQRLARREADAFLDGRSRSVHPVSYARGAGLVNPEGSGQPGLRARDGRLWFPTFTGAVAVDPVLAAALEAVPPSVHVEQARPNGLPVSASGPVVVAPGERRVAFEYTGITLAAPDQVRYEYRLDGLDPDWIDAGRDRVATYTHVPPGSYVFRVRATRGGGVWSEGEATVQLRVEPHVYETRGFVVASMAGLLALAFAGYRYRTIRLRRRAAELESLVGVRTHELAAEKATVSRFFANISHEFRTPLTLIQGPLDDLLAGEHGEIAAEVRQQLAMSSRNSRRLLRLVDQLLDAARSESGTLRLRARRMDYAVFAHGIAQGFAASAQRRAIDFRVVVPAQETPLWFDPDLVEKVLVNLLGNAFKFTPPGGRISLSVSDEAVAGRKGEVVTVVRDSGPGIAAADLPHVFERFYRAESASAQAGAGIGLALARDLVELHAGAILVESTVEGATFTVRLPLGRAHLRDEDVVAGEAERIEHAPPADELDGAVPPPEAVSPQPLPGEAPTILVVDDNAEVRAYLTRHLARRYRVVAADDGESGLRAVRSLLPDVVVSDVMMPGLDGFGLCRAIRQDPETAFIAVILLTARASQESRVEGLELGADDYLAKPFSVRELSLRISNLLAARRRLEERVGRAAVPSASTRVLRPSAVAVTSDDEAFVERLRQTIEEHLGDDAFGVEQLAAAVGQSRATLYRRVQGLFDEPPMDLVWGMRLDRASDLLASRAGSVAEVAYAVGFSSLSHFSRRFKERHGMSPSARRAGAGPGA
jgi:signal transduction histidine kinase/DNA-binding response OmpR family regulator